MAYEDIEGPRGSPRSSPYPGSPVITLGRRWGLESLSMDATVFFAPALSFRVRAGFGLRGSSEQKHTFGRVLLTVDKS